MNYHRVFVRAKDKNGKWYSADAMDLDERSFRLFVLEMLYRAGIVTAISDGEYIEYQSTVERDEE